MAKYDVIVIGAGPAGMTAAVYAVRANLSVLMLERGAPGGKMVNTFEIENYVGVGKIGGPELSMAMFEQTQELDVEYKYGDVTDVTVLEDGSFIVKTTTEELSGSSVIVAAGTVPRVLGVPGEAKLSGKGISWCAICDGSFYKGKDVLVIGAGNSAIEEAIFLTGIVNKVTIINRRAPRADPKSIKAAQDNDKITFMQGYEVVSFNESDNAFAGATFKHRETLEEVTLNADGAFIYIGHNPKTDMVKNLGITDKSGYINVNSKMETSIKGLYACGDIVIKELRQIVTAASDGAIAGQNVSMYLKEVK